MSPGRTMKNIILAAACIYALAGCANTGLRDSLDIQDPTVLQKGFGTQQSSQAGAAVESWTNVYGQIEKPREVLVLLQARLDQLDQRKANYFGYKNQCWIDVAKSEIDAGDRWGFVEELIGEAAHLTAGLEGTQPLSANNPSLRTVAVLRPDLETGLRALIADPRFVYCPQAQKQTACAEVKLMHAGHDAWTRQFGKAKTKVDMVESTLGKARQSLDGCVVPQEGSSSTNLVPEFVALPVDALFAFNGSTVESITSEGRERLDGLIADVKGDGALSSITVSGFTDRLGSEAYNQRLSHERAETVRCYLASGERDGCDGGTRLWPGIAGNGLPDAGSTCAGGLSGKRPACRVAVFTQGRSGLEETRAFNHARAYLRNG
ncbi:MAG: Outer membrane protein A precursor [uncultured Caballeronia sp.]|nr:MAG: Outer membrane protein A precursor [uncultured Caballeronia sp.]